MTTTRSVPASAPAAIRIVDADLGYHGRPVLRVRAMDATLVAFGDRLRHRVVLQVLQRRTSTLGACFGGTR